MYMHTCYNHIYIYIYIYTHVEVWGFVSDKIAPAKRNRTNGKYYYYGAEDDDDDYYY